MPFKHACFISFRHGRHRQTKKAVKDIVQSLYDALSSEMEWQVSDLDVFVDWERLEGGVFLDEALAMNLCNSTCMLVVYTPTYFDSDFCAREYKAMLELEEERLKLLNPSDRQYGLIIPLVCRGEKFLPQEIKRRLYYNFDCYFLFGGRRVIRQNQSYGEKIRQIGAYIAARCKKFKGLTLDPCSICEDFKLPTDEEVRKWREENIAAPKVLQFPGYQQNRGLGDVV